MKICVLISCRSFLPSFLPSIPPSRQIYLPLHQPLPPHLSQQPFLLAWHLCLCSVDLYFDSMHLCILLMCVFFSCACVHILLPVCVCVANRSYWLVVKPRSLRVFMSEEAERLGGIFPSLKQNDCLSLSPLRQPVLRKETCFPEFIAFSPSLSIRAQLSDKFAWKLIDDKVLNEHQVEL